MILVHILCTKKMLDQTLLIYFSLLFLQQLKTILLKHFWRHKFQKTFFPIQQVFFHFLNELEEAKEFLEEFFCILLRPMNFGKKQDSSESPGTDSKKSSQSTPLVLKVFAQTNRSRSTFLLQ